MCCRYTKGLFDCKGRIRTDMCVTPYEGAAFPVEPLCIMKYQDTLIT